MSKCSLSVYRSKFTRTIVGALFALTVLYPSTSFAHALNYIALTTKLTASSSTISIETSIPLDITDPKATRQEELAYLSGYMSDNMSLMYRNQPCPFQFKDYTLNKSIQNNPQTILRGVFECPDIVRYTGDITVSSELLTDSFGNLDHYMTLTIGDAHADVVLSGGGVASAHFPGATSDAILYARTHSSDALRANTPQNALSRLWQFFLLGIVHIVTGIDHILFLLATVLILTTRRSIFLVITSFTIAHSLTLLLTQLHVIVLSLRIVEPLIALSILVMAIDNLRLLRRQEGARLHTRTLPAFLFGLVHGLGFAGALTNMHIPQNYFFPAVLSFNLGIEVGQVAILICVLPFLYYLRQKKHGRGMMTIGTLCITALAFFWLMQRIFFV